MSLQVLQQSIPACFPGQLYVMFPGQLYVMFPGQLYVMY